MSLFGCGTNDDGLVVGGQSLHDMDAKCLAVWMPPADSHFVKDFVGYFRLFQREFLNSLHPCLVYRHSNSLQVEATV